MRDFSAGALEDKIHEITHQSGAKHPPYLAIAITRFRFAHHMSIDDLVDYFKKSGVHTTTASFKQYVTRRAYPSPEQLRKFAEVMEVSFEELKYGVSNELIGMKSLTGLSPTALTNLKELNEATIEAFQAEAEKVYAQGDLNPKLLAEIPRGRETRVINWILEDRAFLILLATKVNAIEELSAAKQKHGKFFTEQEDSRLDGVKARIQREFLSLIERRIEEEQNNGRTKENKKR